MENFSHQPRRTRPFTPAMMAALDPFDIDNWECSSFATMEAPFFLTTDAMEAFEHLSGSLPSGSQEAAYCSTAFVDGCPCIFCKPLPPSPQVEDATMSDMDVLAADFLEDDFDQVLQILDEEMLDEAEFTQEADEDMSFDEAALALDDIPWPASLFDLEYPTELEVQDLNFLDDPGLMEDTESVPLLPAVDALNNEALGQAESSENIEAELWNILTAGSGPHFPMPSWTVEPQQPTQMILDPSRNLWGHGGEPAFSAERCEEAKPLTPRPIAPAPVSRRRKRLPPPRVEVAPTVLSDPPKPTVPESGQMLLAEHAEVIKKGLSKPRLTVQVNYDFPPGPQNHPDARAYVQPEGGRSGRYGLNAMLKEGRSGEGPWFPEFKGFRRTAGRYGFLTENGEVDTEKARAWGGRVRPCVIEDVFVRSKEE